MGRVRGIVPPYFFVLSVQAMGPHGEAISYGWSAIDRAGNEQAYGCAFRPYYLAFPHPADGQALAYVHSHAPKMSEDDAYKCETLKELYAGFWGAWQLVQQDYPGIVMIARNPWPTESRFLNGCVDFDNSRHWEGPNPLHSLSSLFMAYGMDPLAQEEREENELPAGNPLADARQTARQIGEILEGVEFAGVERVPVPEPLFPEPDPGQLNVNVTRIGAQTRITFDRQVKAVELPNLAAEQLGMHILREARTKDPGTRRSKRNGR